MVTALLDLPMYINVPSPHYDSGLDFELRIFNNGPNDLRIGYVLDRKQWDNPFTGTISDHLVLMVNIDNDAALLAAVFHIRRFLIAKKIIVEH